MTAKPDDENAVTKSPQAFRTISEVAEALDVPQHVLRFWESKFSQVKPLKRGGGRRYYRPEDVALLSGIRTLLYTDGLTIKGVQKILREQGVKAVSDAAHRPARARANGRTNGTANPGHSAEAPAAPVMSHAIGPGTRKELEAVLSRLVETKALLQRARALRTPTAKAQGA